jgi:hypothetical protein
LLPLSFLQLAVISCHHCNASADIRSFAFSLHIISQQTKLQKQILIWWATFLPLPCPKISLTAQETKNRDENVNTSKKMSYSPAAACLYSFEAKRRAYRTPSPYTSCLFGGVGAENKSLGWLIWSGGMDIKLAEMYYHGEGIDRR